MSAQGERVERGRRAIWIHPDRAANDIGTSASDIIADVLHLTSEYGYDPAEILDRARRTFDGDKEDES